MIDNMPPLPEETDFYHEAPSGYTAEQMLAYARAYAEQRMAERADRIMELAIDYAEKKAAYRGSDDITEGEVAAARDALEREVRKP